MLNDVSLENENLIKKNVFKTTEYEDLKIYHLDFYSNKPTFELWFSDTKSFKVSYTKQNYEVIKKLLQNQGAIERLTILEGEVKKCFWAPK